MGLKYRITNTHISRVRYGDYILLNGELKYVSPKDINNGFMGTTLFGDSYDGGRRLVPVATIFNPLRDNLVDDPYIWLDENELPVEFENKLWENV